MARITVEDCVLRVPSRFELVMLAAQRARDISAGAQLSLKGPGGFVDIGPGGVTIQGTMVNINSGGSAGSGSGSKPKAPEAPQIPDDATKNPPEDAVEAKPTTPTKADNAKTGHKSAPS